MGFKARSYMDLVGDYREPAGRNTGIVVIPAIIGISDRSVTEIKQARGSKGLVRPIFHALTLTRALRTRAHFNPQHWLLCHVGLY